LLLAALAFAACEDEAEPPLLTRMDLSGAAALVSLDGALHLVAPDGSGHAVQADGWTLSAPPGSGHPCPGRAKAVELEGVGDRVFIYFLGEGEGTEACRYLKAHALVEPDGLVGWLPAVEQVREAGATLVGRDEWNQLFTLRREGAAWVQDADLAHYAVWVTRFWTTAAGGVLYEGYTEVGGAIASRLGLGTLPGPLVTLDPGEARFSEAWRGPDGELRLLRTAGGVTTLLRADLGASPGLVPLASWPARERELDARVERAGDVPVLVEPGRLRAFLDPDAAPVEVAVPDFLQLDRSGFGALWFRGTSFVPGARGARLAVERVARFTPAVGFEDLAVPTGYDLLEVIPYASDRALVLARSEADLIPAWLDLSLEAVAFVDPGLPPEFVYAALALD